MQDEVDFNVTTLSQHILNVRPGYEQQKLYGKLKLHVLLPSEWHTSRQRQRLKVIYFGSSPKCSRLNLFYLLQMQKYLFESDRLCLLNSYFDGFDWRQRLGVEIHFP